MVDRKIIASSPYFSILEWSHPNTMQKYLFLITALITIGLTSLVSIPGSPYLIGGMTQADISNMFATSVTPAGVTFAIWSVIYLSWILAGLVLARLPLTRLTQKYFPKIVPALTDSHTSSRAIGFFSLAIALTFVWLIPWGTLYIGVALIIMLAILALLSYVFTLTRSSSLIVRSSLEITLAWIIMATALNLTVWMRYMGWSVGWPSDVYYAIFALGAILLVISELQCRYRTYVISSVFLWTLLGVYIAHPILEIRWAVIIYMITIGFYIIESLRGKNTSLKALKFW